MTNYRQLCAELVEAWDATADFDYNDFGNAAVEIVDRARAALAEPEPEGPTVMQIIELADEIEKAELGQVDLVRAALTRWGLSDPMDELRQASADVSGVELKDHFGDAKKLSHAANAVWEAFNEDEAGVFVDYGDKLAAALRAAADQGENLYDPHEGKVSVVRVEHLLAIAAELEANSQVGLTCSSSEPLITPQNSSGRGTGSQMGSC